jgi:A/G-specific adenine glycosylase
MIAAMKNDLTQNISADSFQKMILAWFDGHGRKTLPWQYDKTPYRVWVSEIMLQQTQVSTVIPYFERFMQRFPDLLSLASAKEDEVLHLWTGLGYYSRARNLQRAAQHIAHSCNGVLPNTLEELQCLPGIGRSTAGAILAIAFKQRATILDGNVKRVLTRLFGITDWPGEKKVNDRLWEIAERLSPTERIDDYTQAMMDIGATVCVRGKPVCEQCPLTAICSAKQLGIEKKLPHPKPKKNLPIRQTTLLILRHAEQVILEKRPPTGIWGGLWSLPELPHLAEENAINAYCQQRLQLWASEIKSGIQFRHTFSHFHLDIQPVFVTLPNKPTKIMDDNQQIWYNLNESQAVGLPAPIKKILRNLL